VRRAGPGRGVERAEPVRHKRAVRLLLAIALVLPALAAARAHPHGWIDIRTELLTDDEGRVTGLRQAWLFDELYSAFMLDDLEREGRGRDEGLARLSRRDVAANAVRLQLHALAYNLANFVRTLALPKAIETWSLTSLRERLIKTGTRLVRHGRYALFQMAEAALPRSVFHAIIGRINALRGPPPVAASA